MRSGMFVPIAALMLVSFRLMSAHSAESAILAGNHPPDAERMTSSGDADPNQALSMEIHFAVRNQAALDRLLAEQQDRASPNYRKWLATGEYNQRFGPRPADLDAVAAWLKGEGFTIESASDGYLRFSGTVAQAERTFATRIARFGNGSIYANVDDPSIPARFSAVISSITGLDNMTRAVPLAKPPMRIKPRPQSAS